MSVIIPRWGNGSGVGAIRQWWSQPDHYEWMVSYLDDRGVLVPYRGVAAVIVGCLGTVPMLMVASPAGPRAQVAQVASIIVSIIVIVMAAVWVVRRTRRPSQVQSQLFSVLCTGCVATMCLVQSVPLVGLLGCTAFAVLTTYISFFHTAVYMLVNLVAGGATTVALAARLVTSTGDVALALSVLIVLTALNLAVPLAVQSLLRALGMDLTMADRDPLTGLLNRRAFYREAATLLGRHRMHAAGKTLVVIMVDLDKFKALNDRHGHAAGDQALKSVAGAIRRSCPHKSVLARVGGEEFVIAGVTRDPHVPMAHRILRAVADLPVGVTASIGTASSALDDVYTRPLEPMLTDLIRRADDAMYRAKRAGGDRVAHHQPEAQADTG